MEISESHLGKVNSEEDEKRGGIEKPRHTDETRVPNFVKDNI